MTEEEIYNGILKSSDPAEGCYWFKRNITDLTRHTKNKLAKRYIDMSSANQLDEEALSLLSNLRCASSFLMYIGTLVYAYRVE